MQESQFCRHDVSNVGEILEQFGGTYSREDRTAGHGEKENRTIIKPHVTKVRVLVLN